MLEHKRKSMGFAALALATVLLVGRAFPATQIEKYAARVEISSPQAAEVSIYVAVKGSTANANSQTVLCRLVRYSQQEIYKLEIESGDKLLPAVIVSVDGAMEVRLPPESEIPSQYSVHYSVISTHQLRRIPLAVVDASPSTPDGPVEIQTNLAPGYVSVGANFPTMEWRDRQHGAARLNAIPSVVVLNVKRVTEVSIADRLFDMSTMSTLLMFSFVLISSLVWYLRSR